MKIELELTEVERTKVADLMAEKAMELQDDGNEDSPDAALLWAFVKKLRAAKQAAFGSNVTVVGGEPKSYIFLK